MISKRVRCAGRLAAMFVLGALAACSLGPRRQADQGAPRTDAGPAMDQGGPRTDARPPDDPAAPAAPRFAFLEGDDELSRALAAAYLGFVGAPTSSEQAQTLAQQRSTAAAALARDPEGAAAKVIAALAAVEQADPADEEGPLVLLHLLGEVESERGLGALHDFALRALPPADQGQAELDRSPRQALLLLRGVAADELGRRAAKGSQAAKVKLLDLVAKGDSDVRAVAIRSYYRASKLRWKAKRELEAKLAPADRYLVHQIY
jgi:hypothetical protein